MRPLKVDLVKVIDQAWPQVWGSDERAILRAWLQRNTEDIQCVELDLDQITLPPDTPIAHDPPVRRIGRHEAFPA